MFWIVLTQTYLNLEFQAVRRITPGCLLALCFFTLVPLMGSGPIWREKIVPQVAACNQTWWAVALNVNNFIHADGMLV
ncbi:hypothetical protein IscW_ISCW006885 [Ixodes scapularis]|uniref:Uncharacterized protein n=1 Tax=Ixodes scapularis TaxID=6945 RepID=B7PRA6_IXOSC|nr:hypothetical protein IscW_ISCW006885 [Ixodes scapularis]|eukprot:XP_002436298.1 hypothetical protein IscW_ISCW006885 [Ixodes scapularis]